jgi:hypothetical protein
MSSGRLAGSFKDVGLGSMEVRKIGCSSGIFVQACFKHHGGTFKDCVCPLNE